MRNVLNKRSREGKNTDYMVDNLFSKIMPFMRYCRNSWWSQRDHKWRQNMAHTRCMLYKQGYINARPCTRPRARVHECASERAHAHTHNHTQICNIYCFSTVTMIRESVLILRYTYCYILIQKEEYSFHQQTGLKFRKETSEVLLFEHSIAWCRILDISESRPETPVMFWNVVPKKDGISWTDRVRN